MGISSLTIYRLGLRGNSVLKSARKPLKSPESTQKIYAYAFGTPTRSFFGRFFRTSEPLDNTDNSGGTLFLKTFEISGLTTCLTTYENR